MVKIKWYAPESTDGERTLKQHGFIASPPIDPYRRARYYGNRSLCDQVTIGDENEDPIPFAALTEEPLDRNRACKRCLKKALHHERKSY